MEVINIDVMCYRYHLIHYCRFLYSLVAKVSFNFSQFLYSLKLLSVLIPSFYPAQKSDFFL